MENSIKKQVEEVVSNNVRDYFANSINSVDFVEKNIREVVSVSTEQEEIICNILAGYQNDWDSADCDDEGPTREQDMALDKIIEKCGKEISNYLKICHSF